MSIFLSDPMGLCMAGGLLRGRSGGGVGGGLWGMSLGGWYVFLLCPNVVKGVPALCECVCVLEVCVVRGHGSLL